MKVAIVDDDYTARTLISEYLEDEGHDVTAVDDPTKLADVEQYQAIVMDVMIGSDRYKGINYILERQSEGTIGPHTLVVFISNFGHGPEIRSKLAQVRVHHRWLDKPIDLPELDRFIHGRSQEGAAG
jgi:CheY-like chemotaxis protein